MDICQPHERSYCARVFEEPHALLDFICDEDINNYTLGMIEHYNTVLTILPMN